MVLVLVQVYLLNLYKDLVKWVEKQKHSVIFDTHFLSV